MAVDRAQAADHPVAAINEWQRAKLYQWRTDPSLACAPLMWASVATICAPNRRVAGALAMIGPSRTDKGLPRPGDETSPSRNRNRGGGTSGTSPSVGRRCGARCPARDDPGRLDLTMRSRASNVSPPATASRIARS